MLYNLVRGPQVCQLFSCYVSPSINKVLTNCFGSLMLVGRTKKPLISISHFANKEALTFHSTATLFDR